MNENKMDADLVRIADDIEKDFKKIEASVGGKLSRHQWVFFVTNEIIARFKLGDINTTEKMSLYGHLTARRLI